jgi:hypothetical protein
MSFFFFFYKVREQEGRIGLVRGEGVCYQWEGKDVGKGCGRMSMVQILCAHVCKWKMIPVETIPGMGGRRIKENGGEGEFNYDIFDTL